MKISVIVTNWNGVNLLKKNLIKIIENSPEANEFIFADDASDDNSVEYVKSLKNDFPKIKILASKTNKGFGINTNNAVKNAIGDLVVLLNNDIIPHKNYIKNTLHHFQDKKVFGVGFAELGHENWAKIFWKNGYLQYEAGTEIDKTHISAWVSGGSSIIRKEYFQKLNGFDPIYKPFYSEDLDLGFRAWKSGYILLWEPKSIVEHKHESTTSKFPRRFSDYVKERNRLLATLRNIDNPKLVKSNKIAQFFRVLSGPNYIKIIFAAKRQLKKYPQQTVFPVISDIDVLKKFDEKS